MHPIDDLETEYTFFKESLYQAHSILKDLLVDLDNVLYQEKDIGNKLNSYTKNLGGNFFYLAEFENKLKFIINDFSNILFIKKENFIPNNIIIFPTKYDDQDIWVYGDEDLSFIWNSKKDDKN